MKQDDREIIESILYQGPDESIAYRLDTTNWGGSASTPPSSPVVTLWDEDGSNVSSTKMTGSPSIVSDYYVQTPVIHSLVNNDPYYLVIQFTISGNDFVAWSKMKGQRY